MMTECEFDVLEQLFDEAELAAAIAALLNGK